MHLLIFFLSDMTLIWEEKELPLPKTYRDFCLNGSFSWIDKLFLHKFLAGYSTWGDQWSDHANGKEEFQKCIF